MKTKLSKTIPFNKPYLTGKEFVYLQNAHNKGQLAGDGAFTESCHNWLEKNIGCRKALLTHSCTAALEMAAILINTQTGDEIIMPSYTFVSTANAFVLRGGTPVFVDIRQDTLNIDERLIEGAITSNTKAIVVVHYAGVACEMDTIMKIAKHYGLFVIEDAAQGIMSYYKNRALGTIGHFGCLSFHETKNVISGEGGALLINDNSFIDRAEIIREKGTDRNNFFRGQVDKYSWKDVGSSFLPGELIAAFLYAQLEEAKNITIKRINAWNEYNNIFTELEPMNQFRLMTISSVCKHNAHMYYLLLPANVSRDVFILYMNKKGINCTFHYIPLHTSKAGRIFGRSHLNLITTEKYAQRLVRLPLWIGITKENQEKVVNAVIETLKELC